jgi:hypothetical protein
MFNLNQTDRFLEQLTEAEVLKDHPIIQSVASKLTSQFCNVVIDNEEIKEIAERLAHFQETTGASNEVIQHALIAADSKLAEIQEGYFHTY